MQRSLINGCPSVYGGFSENSSLLVGGRPIFRTFGGGAVLRVAFPFPSLPSQRVCTGRQLLILPSAISSSSLVF
ncbi:uncharacterized [Tachysurus ichikawai]